jgi:hypothetical protein
VILVGVNLTSSLTGISREALRRRVQYGSLPAYEDLSGHLCFDVEDVKRLKARKRFPVGPPPLPSYLPAAPVLAIVGQMQLPLRQVCMQELAGHSGMSWTAWERALGRAKVRGVVTSKLAERFAFAVGRRLEDLWEVA